ncbi:polysaccharide biosynthesis protein [Poseidonocella sedimentorum]|uniref:NDP-sugar epimerase, includes UDP-GlcNAc-inverting 4,6-dehydratase FlaA1 and capsular polysaccharide biosynthesis protein EpsC n=1 Tax=Poseidonocella sedimentorum TaxID=871652 RepID=A0A1I6D8S0_9RHOB|nr:nucleoside-diphosphate sugar epimerase/dehydratase [Poseidonocella sedimentorum]SFR01824.1 NDP-sugar epimerase, includes UDP-GlcNAc-inverting 4,6-dehydratase FlaA1 and capsular polysaccharide biosynthesis protein EpsC [Poseidonocella sedimentorum]
MKLYEICIGLQNPQKQAIFLFLDFLAIVLSFALARGVTGAALPLENGEWALLAALLFSGLGLSVWFGLHKIKLNAFESHGMVESLGMAAGTAALGLLFAVVALPEPRSGFFVVFGLSFLVATVSGRLTLRQFVRKIYDQGKPRRRIVIYGAGHAGQQLAMALRSDHEVEPVAFVDDEVALQRISICGLKVYPSTNMTRIVRERSADLVVLAMPTTTRPIRARIVRQLRDLGCEVRDLPSFAQLVLRENLAEAATARRVSELLGRNQLEAELPGTSDSYSRKSVLVTGAGGSIGAELCRQVLALKPARVILVDHSELALYNVERELAAAARAVEIIPVLGSICEEALVRDLFERFEIDVVFHAAAYKHLPMVEGNVVEGMRNNVLGTKTVAEAARDFGAERFILVSTDKAVRPESIMGASKRIAEMVIQDLATRSPNTFFSMVRFGNVLGSSGSVVPLFEEQIARGGPVTLTDWEVSRYFMTVTEAVRLVLLAGSLSRGGDVFVLDMGDPVPIRQLARQMIEDEGYSVRDASNPSGDIEIQVTGLRPGEKLHEELLIGSDMLTTPHNKILRAQERHLSEIQMAKLVRELRRAIEGRDSGEIRKLVSRSIETGDDSQAALTKSP